MKRYAVIGNPIDHSLSPLIHHHFADKLGITNLSYEKILGDEAQFESQVQDFFKQGGLGLNITMPFKTRAYEMADTLSPEAKAAKAANVLSIRNGLLHADNTDGRGLVRDLSRYLNLNGKRVLIIGAGGAVRGIVTPLFDAKIASLSIVNRSLEKRLALSADFPMIKTYSLDSEELAETQMSFDVCISAIGMQPAPSFFASPTLYSQALYYDLSYTKDGNTPFVREAKARGLEVRDGLGMLVEQAAEAFSSWHKVIVSETIREATLKQLSPN